MSTFPYMVNIYVEGNYSGPAIFLKAYENWIESDIAHRRYWFPFAKKVIAKEYGLQIVQEIRIGQPNCECFVINDETDEVSLARFLLEWS